MVLILLLNMAKNVTLIFYCHFQISELHHVFNTFSIT
jgi:hypothetical protein